MRYVYDLGDWWKHEITLERIIEPGRTGGEPAVSAVRLTPVEDWFPDCGRDPTPFNLDVTNRGLARRHKEEHERIG